MLKTRFIIHEFENWLSTFLDFEKKIEVLGELSLDSIVEINNYVDEYDFVIEIIINKREIK